MSKKLGPPDRPLPDADYQWTWTPAAGARKPWFRIYHRSAHTPDGVTFRSFGPMNRFDHHTPPITAKAIAPEGRSVIYYAVDLATAACEVFGEEGFASVCSNFRVTLVRPVREIVTYDLARAGSAMAIGAVPALASGHEDRELTQQWAQAIYEDQPAATKVEGIHYRTAYRDNHSIALWDCPDAIEVARDATGQPLDIPLNSGRGRRLLLNALDGSGIPVSFIADDDCKQCRRSS
ncbi:RES domain-containing protein [Rhodococcus hoagii]|nr:RES domain-containing protein [Prescottella equi]NKW46184.1 RES domain-containing protein [Prescottella equi]